MSDSEASESGGGGDLPEAIVRNPRRSRRRISVVWVIPIVALVIGVGLAWRSWENRGINITIEFSSAESIIPGQTAVRFRNVDLGVVSGMSVSKDRDGVQVDVRMQVSARAYLTEGTKFWVVKPRITASGVTGLGTLLSGAYIAMYPGPKTAGRARHFVGLEQPPSDPAGTGLALILTSDRLHGLTEGAGIYRRGVQVGAVDRFELDKSGDGVTIYASIPKVFAPLVHENSEFRIVGGFDLTASLSQGVEFDMESLRAFLAGGLMLETPRAAGPQAETGATFRVMPRLHRSASAKAAPAGPRFVLETPQLNAIAVGNPVLYRGDKVGSVVSYGLRDDGRSVGIKVAIASRYARLVRTNSVFWNVSGVTANFGLSGFHVHADSLQSLIEGGIAFATPNEEGAPAAGGSVFSLRGDPPKHHEKWKPRIWIGRKGQDPSPNAAELAEPQKVHHLGKDAGDKNSHHWYNRLLHFHR